MEDLRIVGNPLPRIDALEKVTGKVRFAGDIKVPGTLEGDFLLSPYPHARILNINLDKAMRVLGVKGIISGEDIPNKRMGQLIKDQYLIARDKVRFSGEIVACVAASDKDIAKEAIDRIEVDYEPLAHLFDPEISMVSDNLFVHEDLLLYKTTVPLMKYGNVATHLKIHAGDVEKGLLESERVFEDVYYTPAIYQAYIEPHTSLATIDLNGRATIYCATKGPFRVRQEIEEALDIPMSKVRVISPIIGGDFGGKTPILQPLALLLAQKTFKLVRLTLDFSQMLKVTHPRHPCKTYLKLGVKRNGTFVALKAKAIYDSGAYADTGPRVVGRADRAQGVYNIPHTYIEGFCVYTNKPAFGNCRAPGTPQQAFAIESLIETVSRDLGIDPLEIRRKNGVRNGDISGTGQVLHEVSLLNTLEEIEKKCHPWKKEGNRGIGIACGDWHSGTLPSSAYLKLNEDGTIVLSTGVVEQGGGAHTTLAQIVAEVMGLELDDIRVVAADTDITPIDGATGASRVTFTVGENFRRAASDMAQRLKKLASQALEANIDDLVVRGRKISVKGSPEKSIPFSELLRLNREGPIATVSSLNRPRAEVDPSYTEGHTGPGGYGHAYSTQLAAVEVDAETGEVKIERIVACQDVGFAINPLSVEGQIEGGISHGVGYALFEGIIFSEESGEILNGLPQDYKIPGFLDMPIIESLIVEIPSEDGPFGAKGAGELPVVPTAPAIANAIYNACGVRIKELPITKEKVFFAIKEKRGACILSPLPG